jgi:hypothetical protein
MKSKPVCLCAVLVWCWGLAMADAQGVPKITATGQHHGGQVVYRYEVNNASAFDLKRVIVGQFLAADGNGASELSVIPRTALSHSLWLAPEVAARPAGWGVGLVFPEESETFSLEWIEANHHRQLWPGSPALENAPLPQSGDRSIAVGATSNQFSVAVPRIDPQFVNGHATFDVGGRLVNVPITRQDRSPPELVLTAYRLNKNKGNGEYALFEVHVSATDNEDPAPELSVVITANQPPGAGDVVQNKNGNNAWNLRLRNVPGRIYTMTATATDASGNVAVRTFTYAVAG